MLGAVLLVVAMAWPAHAATEHIRDYRVGLTVRADGLVHVHEVIAYDFGDARGRHGIERVIPYRDGRRLYDIKRVRVTADGKRATTETDYGTDTLKIRIGDKDTTVKGVWTYAIDFDVARALTPYKGHDELYWDAIGTGWSVPMDTATVRVDAPAAPTYADCFAGHEGSPSACGGRTVAGNSASFTQRLGAHQGITVRVGLPKGAVHVPPPHYARPRYAVTWVGHAAVGLVCALLLATRAWVRWRQRPRPVPDLLALVGPAEARYLLARFGRARDASYHEAVLIDLAIRGHLRIDDDGEKVTLTRQANENPLRPYEQTLLEKVFGSRKKVRVSKARRTEVRSLRMTGVLYDALRTRKLIRRFDSYDYELVLRTLGIIGLVTGAVLVIVDLWGHFDIRVVSVGDLTAVGVAFLIAGAAALLVQERVDSLTFAGTRTKALLEGYAPSRQLELPDADRHLPYAVAYQNWPAVERFGADNAARLDWYSYTGDEAQASERFTALGWLFTEPGDAPARSSDGRWSYPSRGTSTGSSGGYSSSTTYSPPSYGGGGGGHVGGGGGGGGGGSW
ncbi:DUF2207 domain-containing protein [Actinomadura sp. NPDC048394]|uniref:DUF2207 domain-containing protein n=1 Tax=Actinomadura sp. NPDC048394 TaxID=3158223 RepID=UPI0033F47D39